MTPFDSHVARIRAEAEQLTGAQRAALANELVLSIDDSDCARSVGMIARNAQVVSSALDRQAFLERDRQRRVTG